MNPRCRHGHLWTEHNTKWAKNPNGRLYRQCRTCSAAYKKKRYRCDPAYREKQIARVKKAQAAARHAHATIMDMMIGAVRMTEITS